MKLVPSILIFAIIFLMTSCGGEPTSSQQNGTDAPTDTTATSEYETSQGAPWHNCEIAGSVEEGNEFFDREENLLVAIVADSTTYDETLGESHRILEVYNTENCERIQRQELPINVSPDFPYLIAEITYNNAHNLVGIRGFNSVYCYDIKNRELLPRMEPQYKQERYGVDAQSGMIQHLEVWENYLIGYARDYGTFAFDLSDKEQPEPVLPFAEYENEEQFYSLFLFDLGNNQYQAIMPEYNQESDSFAINPQFTQPTAVSTNIPDNARNNRFLVLRKTDENRTPYAIDLLQKKRIELPATVQTAQTKAILDWLKENS